MNRASCGGSRTACPARISRTSSLMCIRPVPLRVEEISVAVLSRCGMVASPGGTMAWATLQESAAHSMVRLGWRSSQRTGGRSPGGAGRCCCRG
ncbi:MAG TPA: hypothetical protein PKZ65_09595 [Methanoregulaceae archaeon]|nr:hypothetical protein [Methanoregulaceae archaeon]